MILSICICTMTKRFNMLLKLLKEIDSQVIACGAQDIVEVLVDGAEEITTGAKRNALYKKAKGKYVCSVDDDDEIAPYYIQEILNAAAIDADAIAINGTMTTDGRNEATWDISRANPYARTTLPRGRIHYKRYHNHLSPIRREIALQFPFPDQTIQEDYAFATAIHQAGAIKTEVKITRPMYHYKYVSIK